MKDIFFQKKGENVHNFHPRPPCIIVPIATGAICTKDYLSGDT